MKILLKSYCFYIFFFVSNFACSFFMYGDTLDGTSSIMIQSTQYTPTSSGASTAEGFVWFQAGFANYDSSSSLTLQIVPPVNGTINLNGGAVALTASLNLDNQATITGSGTISGAGNAINMTNYLSYSGTSDVLTFSDDVTINGNGHTLTIGGGSQFVVNSTKTLTLKNMTLVLNSSTTPVSVAGTLALDNVRVVLGANTTFSTGDLTVKGKCSLFGPAGTVFTYSSSGTLSISGNAELLVEHGITFKHNYASSNNIVFADQTACLSLLGSSFESAARTLVLKKGTLKVDHHSYIKGSGGSGNVTLGDNTDPLSIVFLPGSLLEACGNTVSYANPN